MAHANAGGRAPSRSGSMRTERPSRHVDASQLETRQRAMTTAPRQPVPQHFGPNVGSSLAEVAKKADRPPIRLRTGGGGSPPVPPAPSMGEGLLRRARSASAAMRALVTGAPVQPPERAPTTTAPGDLLQEPSRDQLANVLTRGSDVRSFNAPAGQRRELVALRRQKLVLLGPGEAGKSSLMLTFTKGRQLVKALPDVGTTTGIDTLAFRVQGAGGDKVDVEVQDFAGQDIYHSHSLFLSRESVFIFVWDMSLAEDAGLALTKREVDRFKRWADIVQAKCPGAVVAAVGTHLDSLRDPSPDSVGILLERVRGMLEGYFATFQGTTEALCLDGGVHAVSCKDLTCTPHFPRIKDLFQDLAELCLKRACRNDQSPFPDGLVPRSVVYLITRLQALRDSGQLVLPWSEYRRFQREVGIPSEQAHAVTCTLHDWGFLYYFDQQSLRPSQSDCVFLRPEWLAKACAAVFTYVHACLAPPHERACMRGTIQVIDVPACDAADPEGLITTGILTTHQLAPALFRGPLQELGREPTAPNCELCLSMLTHLDVVYPDLSADSASRTPSSSTRGPAPGAHTQYYLPSMFTDRPPPAVEVSMPILAATRGVRRCHRLRPFPQELVHMLHCRLHTALVRIALPPPPQPPPETAQLVLNRWNTAEEDGLGFDPDDSRGGALVVRDVYEGTPASRAKAEAYIGWSVVRVGSRPVRTQKEYLEACRGPDSGRRLTLQLERRNTVAPQPVVNTWKSAWWLGGGGGEGQDLGRGPIRCFVVADPAAGSRGESGGTVEIMSVGERGDAMDGGMTAQDMADYVTSELVRLLRKFPGITLMTVRSEHEERRDELASSLRQHIAPPELEFLLDPSPPRRAGSDLRDSLILDSFLKSAMSDANMVAAAYDDL
eukprot:Hpha_TRINITY_DN12708_c0_g1::TRINITY_DN12708_c0_g1_i1::g.114501::m.114501